jgi:hypothetical protein
MIAFNGSEGAAVDQRGDGCPPKHRHQAAPPGASAPIGAAFQIWYGVLTDDALRGPFVDLVFLYTHRDHLCDEKINGVPVQTYDCGHRRIQDPGKCDPFLSLRQSYHFISKKSTRWNYLEHEGT